MTDEDIERMLSPGCEFKISAGFAGRVVQEAEALSRRRPRRRILIPIAASVAAAIGLIILSVRVLRPVTEHDPVIVASVVEKRADVTAITSTSADHAEIHNVSTHKEPEKIINRETARRKPAKRSDIRLTEDSEEVAPEPTEILLTPSHEAEAEYFEAEEEIQMPVVTKGPMINLASNHIENSTRNNLVSEEPEDYLRKLQISFIRRTRMEIAATEAMLKRISETEPVTTPI